MSQEITPWRVRENKREGKWPFRLGVGRRANNPTLEKIFVTKPSRKLRNDSFDDDGHDRNSRTRKRKTTLNLVTWNVRTVLQVGKMAEVAREVPKYRMDCGIARNEMEW